MEYSQFCEECTRIFRQNALPDPTQEQLEKLHFLTEYLLKVNQSMNLTAIRDEKQVILKHYADSLTLLPYLPEGAKMLDVGCGAGFPYSADRHFSSGSADNGIGFYRKTD